MQKLHQYIQFYRHIVGQASCLSVASLLATNINVNAQIIPDTTLPATTIVNSVGTNAQITGGTQFGVNLFHSFLQFSIDGTSITAADFVNPGVTNIISRVTGGFVSNINGLISAGNANLFLINPSGIIFGLNAKLQNVGSFVGTTADSLKFADGNEFSAKNPTPPLLTMNVPVGLQFGSTPGSIIVQGIGQTQGFATQIFDNSLNPLQVSPNQTLALIGGNVQLNGGILQGPGGRVELAGVGSGGQIGLNPNFSLNLPDGVPRADVSLSNGAAINALNSVTDDGGSISIYGQNINLAGGSLLSTGVAENLGISNGKAGDISLNATNTVDIDSSRIQNNVNVGAAGNGGNINIGAGALSLTNSQLDVGLFGGGNAGNILIGVVDGVSLENSQLFSDVVGGNGGAGDIYILAGGRINIADTLLSSDAFSPGVAGNAGYIAILSPNDSIVIGNSTISTQSNGGNSTDSSINDAFDAASTIPGEIFILGKTISLLSNSTLNASAGGAGYAGAINLFADDKVEIADSTITSDANNDGGLAGFVGISGRNSVSLENSAITSTSNNDNTSQFSQIIILAPAGLLNINQSTLNASNADSGLAGDIILNARDWVTITNNSTLLSQGFSGRILIGESEDSGQSTSPINVLIDSSRLNSNSFEEFNAGKISINASDTVNIANSFIRSDAFDEESETGGNAGLVEISANNAVSLANTTVTTDSFGFTDEPAAMISQNATSQTVGVFLDANNISITDNSLLSSTAFGSNTYTGEINLYAKDTVEITDSTIASDALSLDQQSGGYSGFVGIGGGNLVSINNSSITADSFGSADSEGLSSGEIDIAGGNIGISNGAKISTNIFNDGVAGFVSITANDKFSLTNSSIQSNSQSSNPQRSGDAGDIAVNARFVDLNQGKIEASSASGNGGGITFKVQDLVVLRNSSLIATNAGSQGNPGSGGVIDIDPRFVVGVNNSDITANSFNGAGGEITITATEGIFGLKVRSQLTPLNDITAFSQTNPQLNGTIEVFSPDVDPSTGLTTLSANFIDASRLVTQDICKPKQQQSAFTITGRGGLPPNPYEIIAPDITSIEWATRESENQHSTGVPPVILNTNQESSTNTKQIVEAQGLTIAPDGTVILTANPSIITPHSSGFTSPGCQ